MLPDTKLLIPPQFLCLRQLHVTDLPVQVPLLSVLFVYVKAFYFDSELSISDNYVKTSQILHNSSLIQGRQIINILPEG